MSDTVKASHFEESVVLGLYAKFNELFGQSSQAFCMEYPPRVLNPLDYAYPITDHNSWTNKPTAVAEAEFMLADQMVDLAPIVSGTSGERLSSSFKVVVNNYIPQLKYASRMAEQKGKLKHWLLKPVEGQVMDYDEDTDDFNMVDFSGTRLEYSAKLYRTYLKKREAHKMDVEGKRSYAQKHNMMDDFQTWLANTAATEEAILSTFYNDAVVRGQLHEVNAAISFLDIPSLGQMINDIKQEMRSTVKRSVAGNGDVYPVNFSPSNWFDSLTASPTPIQILTNTSYRRALLKNKHTRLTAAQLQLTNLRSMHIEDSEVKKLQELISKAEKDLDEKFTKLNDQYNERMIESVKMAYSAAVKAVEFAGGGLSLNMVNRIAKQNYSATGASDPKLPESDKPPVEGQEEAPKTKLEELVEKSKGVWKTRIEINRLQKKKIELLGQQALAKSSDYDKKIKLAQQEVDSLKEEITLLESEETNLEGSAATIKNSIIAKYNQSSHSISAENRKLYKSLILEEESIDERELWKTTLIENLSKLKEDGKISEFNRDDASGWKHPADADHLINDIVEAQSKAKDAWKAFCSFPSESIILSKLDEDGYKDGLNDDTIKYIGDNAKNPASINVNSFKSKTEDGDITTVKGKWKQLLSEKTKGEITAELEESGNLKEIYKCIDSDTKNMIKKGNKDGSGNDLATQQISDLREIKFTFESQAIIDAVRPLLTQALEAYNQKHSESARHQKLLTLAESLGVEVDDSKDGNSGFQTIMLKVTKDTNLDGSKQSADATDSESESDYWFLSNNKSEKKVFSSTVSTTLAKDVEIEVKMNVIKVTMNRGAWFGTDLFRFTDSLFHINPQARSNAGYDIKDYKSSKWNTSEIRNKVKDSSLGHYTSAFLIAKDIEITFISSESFKKNSQTDQEETSASASHSWFGSSNNASTNKIHGERNHSTGKSHFQKISIPNPSVIGWFQQIVPEDESLLYGDEMNGASQEDVSKTIDEFLKSVM